MAIYFFLLDQLLHTIFHLKEREICYILMYTFLHITQFMLSKFQVRQKTNNGKSGCLKTGFRNENIAIINSLVCQMSVYDFFVKYEYHRVYKEHHTRYWLKHNTKLGKLAGKIRENPRKPFELQGKSLKIPQNYLN